MGSCALGPSAIIFKAIYKGYNFFRKSLHVSNFQKNSIAKKSFLQFFVWRGKIGMNDGNFFMHFSICCERQKKRNNMMKRSILFSFFVNSNEFSMKIINLINALLIHKFVKQPRCTPHHLVEGFPIIPWFGEF